MATKKAKSTNKSAHLTVRLHADIVARLDALVPVFLDDPTLSPTGKADRTDVIRAALLHGLDTLERKKH